MGTILQIALEKAAPLVRREHGLALHRPFSLRNHDWRTVCTSSTQHNPNLRQGCRMAKISMWWLFIACFALTIGGVQSLGWWTRPAAAQTPMTSTNSSAASAAAARHQNGEPNHWRSIFMHH